MTRVVVRTQGGSVFFPVNRGLCGFLADLAARVEGPVEISVVEVNR